MTGICGRDRVLASVHRTPVDRLPVASMGIDEQLAAKVRELLAAPPGADLYSVLGLDMRGIMPAYTGPAFGWKPESKRFSFFGSSDKTYSDTWVERPLGGARTVQDIERFRWPTIADYDVSEIAAQYGNGHKLALHGPGWTPTFSQLCELGGIETSLINLLDRPAVVDAAVERVTQLVCDMARALHSATNGLMPIFKTSDDCATQRGLMFSPALWRRFFKPGLRQQFDVAKSLGMLTMLHSCGDISAILADLVEIGLDILEPTQAHLPGMQPDVLKREYGAHLTFFGAISTQTTLTFGTPRDIRREVEERSAVLGRDGGYIISPDHELLENVPPENVIALYRAAGSLSE